MNLRNEKNCNNIKKDDIIAIDIGGELITRNIIDSSIITGKVLKTTNRSSPSAPLAVLEVINTGEIIKIDTLWLFLKEDVAEILNNHDIKDESVIGRARYVRGMLDYNVNTLSSNIV